MEAIALAQQAVGEQLRVWRERRRLSQLSLATQAGISARHLSYVETGRSMPSRDMVLRLAEHLAVPPQERNSLLLAAGYAPAFLPGPVHSPQAPAVRSAIRQVLDGHGPYPAMAVDRRWDVVDANASLDLFTSTVAPELLEPPVNALRMTLHPDGLAPRVLNLAEYRLNLLRRLHHRISVMPAPELAELYVELCGYPGTPDQESIQDGPVELVMPMRLRDGTRELTLLCAPAVFGTPYGVSTSGLGIKTYFPGDEATAEALRARHAAFRG